MVYNCVLFSDQEGLVKNKQELICCQRDGLLDSLFFFLHVSIVSAPQHYAAGLGTTFAFRQRLHTRVALKRLLFILLFHVCSQISSHRTADVPTATYSKGTAIKHNVSNASWIQGDANPTTLTTKQRKNKRRSPRVAPDTAKKMRRKTEKYKEPGNLNLHHLNLHPNRTQITPGTPPNYPPV